MKKVELFVKLCDKEELADYINIFDVNVDGFRNANKAPKPTLEKTFLEENKLSKGEFFSKVCEVATDLKISENITYPQKFNIFIAYIRRLINTDRISESTGFCLLLKNHPDKAEKYLSDMTNKHKDGKCIFNLDIIMTDIKKENALDIFKDIYIPEEAFKIFYEGYGDEIDLYFKDLYGEEEYEECKSEFDSLSWSEFVGKYYESINIFDEYLIFTVYLINNKNRIMNLTDEDQKNIHLLLIYELTLQYVSEKHEFLDDKHEELLKEYNELKKQYKSLEKELNKRESKLKRLEKQKNKFEEESKKRIRNLETTIEKKNSSLEQHKKENIKLRDEIDNKVDLNKLLKEWGLNENNLNQNIIIICRKDYELFDLFFGKHEFIDCQMPANDIIREIESYNDYLAIINKARINTNKLLQLEESIEAKNRITIFSSSPKDIVVKVINNFKGGFK